MGVAIFVGKYQIHPFRETIFFHQKNHPPIEIKGTEGILVE
jgi:hypothetical protein